MLELRQRLSTTPIVVLLALLASIAPGGFSAATSTGSSSPPDPAEGEELVYNVRYGPFDLGQVRFRVPARAGEAELQYAKAFIDSYEGVPFVDLHATYESWMDSSRYPQRFIGKSRENGSWRFARYTFDHGNNMVTIETGERDTVVGKRETMPFREKPHDGLSIFFFARDQLFSRQKINIPTYINEQLVNTYIDFHGRRTTVEIDAVDYPLDVIEFNGKAEFVGIFGLTGDFEGWFSNDDARVPVLAKMKVIIGSVTLELMEWKRPGWNPRRGIE